MVSSNCSTCSHEISLCRCLTTKNLACLTCGKTYKLKKFLEKHIQNHHEQKIPTKMIPKVVPEVCLSCGMKLKNKNMLKMHCDTNCGKERNFRCEQCDGTFQTIHALKTHKLIHAGIKKNLCGFCGADFISKGQLKVHERSHTGEKPFSCDLCDKKFAYRESLVTHASIHTGIKPYFCQNCNSRFSCIGNLIKHRRARPDTCGLKIFTNKKIAPRPSVRKIEGKDSKRAKLVLQEIPEFMQAMVEQEASEIVAESLNLKTEEIVNHVRVALNTLIIPEVQAILPILVEIPHETVVEPEAPTERKQIEIISVTSVEVYNSSMQELGDGQSYEIIFKNEVLTEPEIDNFDFIGINSKKDTTKLKEIEMEKNSEVLWEKTVSTIDPQDGSLSGGFSDDEISAVEESEDESNYLDYIRKKSNCYECSLCPKIYRKKHVSIKHLRAEHNVILQKYNYETVNRYRKPSSRAKFKCKICNKKFISKNTLAKHTPFHGPTGSLIFKCSCCASYYETMKKVQDHQYKHHKERLECKICNKLYSHPEKLHNHFRYAHEDLKPIVPKKYCFICTTCGKTFSSRVILSDHERSKCGDSPLYKCPDCKKGFRSLGSLKTHESVHSGKLAYCCSFCVKTFRTSSQVKVHERSHTHDKPFSCTVCPSAFSHRASLSTHMSTHTGIKKYSCANISCTNKFSCYSNLKAHYRTHKLCSAFKEDKKIQESI